MSLENDEAIDCRRRRVGARFRNLAAAVSLVAALGCEGQPAPDEYSPGGGEAVLTGPGGCRAYIDALAEKASECARRLSMPHDPAALRTQYERAIPGGCAAVSRLRDPDSFQQSCLPAIRGIDCAQAATSLDPATTFATACADPFVFGGAGVPDAGHASSCMPETDTAFCARMSATCGFLSGVDNCGTARTVSSCGYCVSPSTCGAGGRANACGGGCTPETDARLCARLGKNCGLFPATDNCWASRVVSCGSCGAGETCGGRGTPNVCGRSCVPELDPTFCARLGKSCGRATGTDNCGQSRTVLSCGGCRSTETCSTAGACACTPETDAAFCQRAGRNCGALTAADNCGRTRSVSTCGSCANPEVCAGSGVQGVCGQPACRPETNQAFCQRFGKNCGDYTAADNCGASRTAACGSCSSPKTCGGSGTANICGCPAESDADFCARKGVHCDSASGYDNCGGWRNIASCGACAALETCGGGGTSNRCGCTAESDTAFCSRLGATCGSLTAIDNCGRTRTVASCGSCSTDNTCGDSNTCQALTCPAGERACGGACRACPTANVKTTICSGPACIAETCNDGYGVSGGACVAQSCPAGQLFCGTACAVCPAENVATVGCYGRSCGIITCTAGNAVSFGYCIDADWSIEPLWSNNSPVLALDASGTLHIAYGDAGDLVLRRRSGSGWVVNRWLGPLSPYRPVDHVKQLVIDGNGNAHAIYYGYYHWVYAKFSLSGAVSLRIDLGGEATLALDGSGDAHVVYNEANKLKYQRIYAGAWLAPIDVTTTTLRSPTIAVDAQGTVHVAGLNGNQLLYIKGVNSIFTTTASVAVWANSGGTMFYLGRATPEIWGRSNGSWYVSTVSGTTISTPTVWHLPATGQYITIGAPGQTGFFSLDRTVGTFTARRGPVTGPTFTEATNLPVSFNEGVSAVIDSNGTMHAIIKENASYYRDPDRLYYVRGH